MIRGERRVVAKTRPRDSSNHSERSVRMNYSNLSTRAWLPPGGAVCAVCECVCVCVWGGVGCAGQRWWRKGERQEVEREVVFHLVHVHPLSSSRQSTVLSRNPWRERSANSAFHLRRPLEEKCRNWLEMKFGLCVTVCICVCVSAG